MLYALVLVITSTTIVQPVAAGPWPYPIGAPYVTSDTSQRIIGYYRSERGCLSASIKRSPDWPDFQPGQSVTGLCVQVEIPAGVDITVRPVS